MHRFALRALSAIVLAFVVAFQGTLVLAGTTGGLNGVVTADGAPLAGARVTVTSPSQQASATTDANGRYNFLSLSPDTYTVSVEKSGFDPQSRTGVTIVADSQISVPFGTKKSIQIIGRATARSTSDLVRPGQTADVYSINATTQDAVSALGGGGGLNNAYSAIATVPGAYVPANQTGYFQTVHIRGGDYDQVGYEVDGIPVNRSFDNYPSGSVSSLGQQELQVYTGATPANAEGAGIAGYINQVIRSGTFPGFKDIDIGTGGPAGYRKANVEFGGATTNRNFTYYVGVGGYSQSFRYVDQFNGQASGNQVGGPLAPCPAAGNGVTAQTVPTCFGPGGTPYSIGYALTNSAFGATSLLNVRDSIVNLHFGIPHGDLKDDVQLLYVNNNIETQYYSSTNDQGGLNLLTLIGNGPEAYYSGYQYSGATGVLLPSNAQSMISRYIYPYAQQTGVNAPLGLTTRDSTTNDQGIVKLQYQHNFSDNAYFRLYGYTYYSDWLQDGPNSANLNYLGTASPDYELSSHTRGISATFSDQINDQNLLSLQGSFTTAASTRDNNTQMFNFAGSRSYFAPLVNASNPLQGICYNIPTAATAPGSALTAVDCSPSKAKYLTFGGVYASGVPNVSGYTCGGSACGFLAGENGLYATYNTVKPLFTSLSATDEFKPSSKLSINVGVRFDRFQFNGSDTTGSPARTFYYNAYNQGECVSTAPGSNPVSKGSLGIAVTAPCTSVAGFTNVNLVNASGVKVGYDVAQPRLGATYTLDASTVLRGSYGKYAQAPNAAYQQYNTLQNDFPYTAENVYNFYGLGFTTPSHTVRPPVSYNTDFSIERRLFNDVSVKISPFNRQTADQIQNFFLNQQTGFVSGLNVGRQTSQGVEFQLNKGSFANDGFSALLSFAYTNSTIKYAPLSNGSTIIDPINASIKSYNAYTSFCAKNPTDSRCGTTQGGVTAAPCYTTAGAPDAACAAGSVGNPYWTAPVQALMNVNANYVPYDIFPGGIGSSAASFETPYVATLVLNYKVNRFSITPSVQFQAGARYGYPLSTPGVAPDTCTAALATPALGDGRYFNGSAGGLGYNAGSCTGSIAIPDPYTGNFDNLGSFRQPSQLLGNMQLAYRLSKNVTLQVTLANIFNTCFGGQQTGFTWLSGSKICSYSTLSGGGAGVTPVGNIYNPSDNVQPFLKYPYGPNYGAYNTDGNSTNQPFSFFIDAKIRL